MWKALIFLPLLSGLTHGQQPGIIEPVYEIPTAIARPAERADFDGEWRRMDRRYRLEISAGESGEEPVVEYFNPKPIHVESAEFREEEGRIVLRVVLRDEGYPGSTYRLFFLPERQILLGSYEGGGRPPAEVYFVREEDL